MARHSLGGRGLVRLVRASVHASWSHGRTDREWTGFHLCALQSMRRLEFPHPSSALSAPFTLASASSAPWSTVIHDGAMDGAPPMATGRGPAGRGESHHIAALISAVGCAGTHRLAHLPSACLGPAPLFFFFLLPPRAPGELCLAGWPSGSVHWLDWAPRCCVCLTVRGRCSTACFVSPVSPAARPALRVSWQTRPPPLPPLRHALSRLAVAPTTSTLHAVICHLPTALTYCIGRALAAPLPGTYELTGCKHSSGVRRARNF